MAQQRVLYWRRRSIETDAIAYSAGVFYAVRVSMIADVSTLILMIVVSSVVMAASLRLLHDGSHRDGLQYWAWGLLVSGAGYALFLLRGRIPDVFSVVLANALLSATFACVMVAVRCFHGLPLHWGRTLAPALAIMGLMLVFQDDFAMRVAITGCVMAAQTGWILWVLHQHRQSPLNRGALLLSAGLALECAVLLLRGGSAILFSLDIHTILQGNVVQTLTFMVAFTVLLVTAVGFLFMGKERADQANRRLAVQDDLTGVANRRAIIAALERDMAQAVRKDKPLALLMIDVDHFKQVNDRWGHPAGDAVLRSVVEVLRQRVRAQDMVGRYGGEEFLVVLPGIDLEGARLLAQQLCAAVQAAPCIWGHESIFVTVSIGVLGGRLQPQDHWSLLLQAADQALYRAKANGRNRVEVASQPL